MLFLSARSRRRWAAIEEFRPFTRWQTLDRCCGWGDPGQASAPGQSRQGFFEEHRYRATGNGSADTGIRVIQDAVVRIENNDAQDLAMGPLVIALKADDDSPPAV